MAKFLDTQAISSELMKLIKEAKEKIILVSYSFKVNPQIQERIKTKSKIGNLSEIVIVYGKTELKKADQEWLQEIQDLKLYEKPNLHAKCYLNEEKAIISSMNLYDYSQQNNIEMGILITKEHDRESYKELLEEIDNIKVNGKRIKIEDLQNSTKSSTSNQNENFSKVSGEKKEQLTLKQKLYFQLLKQWRLQTSRFERCAAYEILTDQEITSIITHKKVDKNVLFDLLPKKTAIRYSGDILDNLALGSKYTIGDVVSVWYQSDHSKYDRVKLKTMNGDEQWFDTTQELPDKNRTVAVRLNQTWFNEYFYLDN